MAFENVTHTRPLESNNPPASSTLRTIAAGLMLTAATATAYGPIFRAGFIWDDDAHVTGNEALHSVDGLRRIWLERGTTPQYYPLTHTTFWLEYHLWGVYPAGYHAVNVLLHIANALLVWRLLRRLRIPAAWWVACLFALHPVHVESAGWVTERKNVLSTFFYLLSLRAYLQFRPLDKEIQTGPRRAWVYVLFLVLFAAALFSKTVACSLPVTILILTGWKTGRIRGGDVWPLLPAFALGLVLAANTVRMERDVVGALGPDWAITVPQRMLIAGRALWFYLGKLIWPVGLSFTYPRWPLGVHSGWEVVALVGALAAVAAAWALRRRIGGAPLAAMLFFGVTLFPALGFFDVYPMRYSFVADHFQYVAGIGPLALLAGGAATLARAVLHVPRLFRAAGAAVLAVVLGGLTWQRCHVFRGPESLWLDVRTKNPDAWIAQWHLGRLHGDRGEVEAATKCYEQVLRIRPQEYRVHSELGVLYSLAGRHAEARREFLAGLKISPNDELLHYNLGALYAKTHQLQAADHHLRRAVRINSNKAVSRLALGTNLVRMKRYAEAIPHLKYGLSLNPDDLNARISLATALQRTGQVAGAIAEFREIVRRNGEYADALAELASLLTTSAEPRLRDGRTALRLAQRANQLTRNRQPRALAALAAAHAELGQFDQAVAVAERGRSAAAETMSDVWTQILDARLAAYRQRRPWYESPVRATAEPTATQSAAP